MCELFSTASRQNKTIQDRNINAKIVPSSSKHNFTVPVPLKNLTVFELLHTQNPCFTFLQMCQKLPKNENHKKRRPNMKKALSN